MLEGLRTGLLAGFTPDRWQTLFLGLGRFLFTAVVVLIGGAIMLRLGQSFIARATAPGDLKGKNMPWITADCKP